MVVVWINSQGIGELNQQVGLYMKMQEFTQHKTNGCILIIGHCCMMKLFNKKNLECLKYIPSKTNWTVGLYRKVYTMHSL